MGVFFLKKTLMPSAWPVLVMKKKITKHLRATSGRSFRRDKFSDIYFNLCSIHLPDLWCRFSKTNDYLNR